MSKEQIIGRVFYSAYFFGLFVVTKVNSDNDWYFRLLKNPEKELKAQTPLSNFIFLEQ